ncbi:MAG: glycosyltransferase family 39 protein [Chloroflexi bacterium]|nr:glycosyltransferase family 39 protein [Chloroflexota bacterium]
MLRRLRSSQNYRTALMSLLATWAVVVMVLAAHTLRTTGFDEIPNAVGTTDEGIVFSNTAERELRDTDNVPAAARLVAAGGILLLLAQLAGRIKRPRALRTPSRSTLSPDAPQLWLIVWGMLLLWIAADASGHWVELPALTPMRPGVQFAFLAAGIALVTLGFGGAHRWPDLRPTALWHSLRRLWARETVVVLGVTGMALLVRVWHLGETYHILIDELNFLTALQGFWANDSTEILVPITRVVAFPKLYVFWEKQFVDLFGRNLATPRLASALIGTLTVPALYLLARTLFDRLTATFAAILLATFPPHMHFSRLALNNVADPLFGTLAFAFLARGLRHNRRLDYALAGACLGLTQYFYEGGRLVFPAVMLGWVGWGWFVWRRRPPWRGLVTLLVVAILVAAPVYYTLLALELPLTSRVNDTTPPPSYWRDLLLSRPGDPVFTDHLLHIRGTFLVYVQQPEGSFFYAGYTPLVLVYLVPALLLGAWTALGRLRVPGMALLLLWICVTSLGNSFLHGNMDAPRYVVAYPALALLCALGLRYPLAMIWPDGIRPRIRRAVVIVLVSAVAALQVSYYFGPHATALNNQLRAVKPYRDGEDALLRAADFPPGTAIHLISVEVFSESYAQGMLHFLNADLTVDTLAPSDLTLTYLWELDRTHDHAFFLEPGDTESVERLSIYFALEPPAYTTYDIALDRQFVLYYAPAPEPDGLLE